MKTGKALLIASAVAAPLLGGLAYFQYAKSSIDFRINGLEFPSTDLSNLMHIKIKFDIHSTLGFSFTIIESRFNIFNGLNMLGSAIQTTAVKVKNRETVVYEADAVIDASVLGDSVFDYAMGALNGTHTSSFLVKGVARVKLDIPVLSAFVVNIPVDEDYSL